MISLWKSIVSVVLNLHLCSLIDVFHRCSLIQLKNEYLIGKKQIGKKKSGKNF